MTSLLERLGITLDDTKKFREFKITDTSRRQTVLRSSRQESPDLRIRRGMFYTEEEWNDRIKKFKELTLP